jgi:hypothetical protein
MKHPKTVMIVLAIGLTIGLAAAWTIYGASRVAAPAPSGTPLPLPTGEITVTGTVVCLPHKNPSGPQTMECAFGLVDDNGDYYGLKELAPATNLDIRTKIRVTGYLELPNEAERYGVVGNLHVSSFTSD